MLTVLITRGQIIIPAGYFPARCPCLEEATLPPAPAELREGQRTGVRVRQAWRRLHPAIGTKGSCGPHWLLVGISFFAVSGIIRMWFFYLVSSLWQSQSICDSIANRMQKCLQNHGIYDYFISSLLFNTHHISPTPVFVFSEFMQTCILLQTFRSGNLSESVF